MNTIDSKEANEELVCIWNAIEERAEDQEIVDYARSKRIPSALYSYIQAS